MQKQQDLQKTAHRIRRDVVDVCVPNGAGHIAPSLSSIDILVALYYRVLRRTQDPAWDDRDRLVFSKAHGCYGLYAILADIGYLPVTEWRAFYKDSRLSGCSERHPAWGIEASCGSLGHGLPMAAGIAFGARLQDRHYRAHCIVGDGEMQEGSMWEALQFAVRHELSNLCVIIDANDLQAMDRLDAILTLPGRRDDLRLKTQAFGCIVDECNGHDPDRIAAILEGWSATGPSLRAPQVLIARTIKGYGLSCMESVPKYHFRLPTPEELAQGKRYE